MLNYQDGTVLFCPLIYTITEYIDIESLYTKLHNDRHTHITGNNWKKASHSNLHSVELNTIRLSCVPRLDRFYVCSSFQQDNFDYAVSKLRFSAVFCSVVIVFVVDR